MTGRKMPLDMLKRHEGKNVDKNGRHIPYICSAGMITIGYGRNLTDNGISEMEAMNMLVHDMEEAFRDIDLIFPEIYSFSPNRRLALLDMMFNLGKPRFLGFKKMIEAVREGDWERAAEEAEDSKWYGQVGSRGEEVVSMLLNG